MRLFRAGLDDPLRDLSEQIALLLAAWHNHIELSLGQRGQITPLVAALLSGAMLG